MRTARPASCSPSAVTASWTAQTRVTRGPAAVSATPRALGSASALPSPTPAGTLGSLLSLKRKPLFARFWSTRASEACPASVVV